MLQDMVHRIVALRGQLGNENVYSETLKPAQVSTYPNVGSDKIEKIAAGYGHSVTSKVDGYVWSFGWNNYSQLGNEDTDDSYVPVIAGKEQYIGSS